MRCRDIQTCQMTCLSLLPPLRGYYLSLFLEVLSQLDVNIVDVFLEVCSHYLSDYNDHYHHYSTCDCCMLWSMTHLYDSCTCSNFCGPANIRSARCGCATTVDSEGHIKNPTCATTAATSVPNTFSGISKLCLGFSTGKVLFQS